MQNSVLERLLVVLYMVKISAQSLLNFVVKFGPKLKFAENWKKKMEFFLIETCNIVYFIISEVFSITVFQYIKDVPTKICPLSEGS
jgi:hypothetical protein